MNSTYLFLQLMFIFVYVLKFNDIDKSLIKKAILIGGISVSIYVFLFAREILTSGLGGRISLNDADPNEFAALLILPLFVSFDMIIKKKSKLNILIFSTLLLLILLTGSRGALAGCVVAIIYFILLKGDFKFFTILRFLIIGGMILFGIFSFVPEFILLRLGGDGDLQNAIEFGGGRTGIWTEILNIILEVMPFYGFGSGSSSILLSQYFGTIIGSHNTYLMIFLEFGILGFTIFLYFLWAIFKKIKRTGQYSTILSFIAIIIIIFFLDSYFKKYLWNVLMFAVIIGETKRGFLTNKTK